MESSSSTHHVIHIPIHYVEHNSNDDVEPEPIIPKAHPTTITGRISRLISVTFGFGKSTSYKRGGIIGEPDA
jgi:hypothetical protein